MFVLVCAFLSASLVGVERAQAWHDEGHVYATLAGTRSLPDEVPAFFREGERTIAHTALDPDILRDDKLPQLKAAEAPGTISTGNGSAMWTSLCRPRAMA